MMRAIAHSFNLPRRNPAVDLNFALRACAAWMFCAALLVAASPQRAFAQAATGTQLSSSTALYARVLRLSHNANASLNGGIVASVTAFPASGGEEDIYGSTNGASFTQIGKITDSDFSGGLCCGTLYELPSAVGTLPAGTLVWSGSVGQSSTSQPMKLKIYDSMDQGKTWSYLSTCATGTTNGSSSGGLWEPQFTVANDGALVCFYSDEQQPGHSQLIHQVRSYDGLNWQDSTFTVASNVQSDRPGMPVVTKLPSGTYFMSYELCGPAACTVFYRTSADGWNWGDSSNVGNKVATASGQYFEHAPYNVWAPSAASANGTILLVGQMMYEGNNSLSPGNGITIFANHSADGSGAWTTMPAPVQVPNAYDNYCPNYSSPLLPSTDGQSVLEFASAYLGSTCLMYYGTGPVLAGTLTPGSVTVTPASTSITANLSVNVTVTVAGATGGPAPTGTVTLSGGGYTSSAATLSSGTATITIPANSLDVAADTLTATYSGDANYLSATGTATITVAPAPPPAFAISAPALTVKAGSTSGNTETVTITPSGSFTGTVTLSAQISSGPAGQTIQYPILAFGASNPVNITGAAAGMATLSIITTAGPSVQSKVERRSGPGGAVGAGLLSLAFFLPICIRRRHSKVRGVLMMLALSAALAAGITGCGGANLSTVASAPGTLPGNYIVTIVGTSSNASATGSFTLTVQ